MPLVRRTRATLRSAEFGFFGVVVYTRVQTPRRWGEPFNAGVLVFSTLSSRPLRTSWLIVGMGGLDLLPALGRADDVLLCWLRLRCRSCSGPDVPGHRPPSGPRGRVCRPPTGRPMKVEPDSVAPRDSAPPLLGRGREVVPGNRKVTQAHREREQAQSTLGTADHSTRAPEAGQNRVPMASDTCG